MRIKDRVPNEQLRQAFLDSGLSATEIARQLDWLRRARRGKQQEPDSTKVQRVLGLRDYTMVRKDGRRVRHITKTVSEADAVKLGEVFGLDPHELDF